MGNCLLMENKKFYPNLLSLVLAITDIETGEVGVEMTINLKESDFSGEIKVVSFKSAFSAQKKNKKVFDEGLFGELHPIEFKKISNKEAVEVYRQSHNFVMRYLLEDGTFSNWECAPIGNMFLVEA